MDEILRTITSLKYKVQDVIDMPDHHLAKELKKTALRLEDEAQVKKQPRTLENTAKQCAELAKEAGREGVISQSDANMLEKSYEDVEHHLRKHR